MLVPGLPDDVAAGCLARVPRFFHADVRRVSRAWSEFITSDEFKALRKCIRGGVAEEELLFVYRNRSWEVVDCTGWKVADVPPMPGPIMAGFGAAVVGHKLLVLGGYSVTNDRVFAPSADVYEFDACLKRWKKLRKMSEARYNFACAEVEGKVYAVGGYDRDGCRLSKVETYDPLSETWTSARPLRCPRPSGFAFGFRNELYLMKNRSSSGSGRSGYIDVYNPETGNWRIQVSGGSFRVSSHAVFGARIFCTDWEDPSRVSAFDPEDGSWEPIDLPSVGGSGSVGFVLGSVGKRLLMIPQEPGYEALLCDPNAETGTQWESIGGPHLSGPCTCFLTMKI